MAVKKKKIELTAEQKALRAKKIAQQKALEAAAQRLPTSFALITGERLLAKMGVSLSQNEISMQIRKPNTYYHALMYLPAKRTQLRAGIERCRDMQAYGQQKLIHYLFSGEASKEETEAGNETRDAIETARLKMVDMGKHFVEWEDVCLNETDRVIDELKERALAWHRTVKMVVMDLKVCLINHGIKADKAFYASMKVHLLECAARLTLTKHQQDRYETPIGVTRVETAVICLLDAGEFAHLLNANGLKKMREEFKRLDALLQTEFDDLRGFNQENQPLTERDLKEKDQFSAAFEKEIIHISQMLFKYYNEYASNQALKVDVSEALAFGVDEAVADDYRALQM